jgi:uncharacterized membrane protein
MNDSTITLGLAFFAVVLVAIIMFIGALHKAIIKDKNKNFVPDKVEDVVKEAQERVNKASDALKGKE